MRIGIMLDPGGTPDPLTSMVAQARRAADDGFPSVWVPHIFGPDALIALTVVGREVPGIELGTAVIPTYPRHPLLMAQQALTANLATGGRLTLGIGLSHQIVIEGMFGYSYERPAVHMREYLEVLLPALRQEAVDVQGDTLRARGAISIAGAAPCPVLLAALAPRMLRLAGATADGTVTWMTGPRTVAEHIVPSLRAAAVDAGRPSPRVVVGLPVCVTDDPEAAQRRAEGVFAIYGQLPAYRAMLDREGLGGPGEIVVAGDEAEVRDRLEALRDGGATDLVASEFGSAGERARTRALLTGWVASAA